MRLQKILITSAETAGILHVASNFIISNILARSLFDVKQVFISSTSPVWPEVEKLNVRTTTVKYNKKEVKLDPLSKQDASNPRFAELKRLTALRSPLANLVYQRSALLTYSSTVFPPETSSLLQAYLNDPNSIVLQEYAKVRELPMNECVAELNLFLEAEAVAKARAAGFVHNCIDKMRVVFTEADALALRKYIMT